MKPSFLRGMDAYKKISECGGYSTIGVARSTLGPSQGFGSVVSCDHLADRQGALIRVISSRSFTVASALREYIRHGIRSFRSLFVSPCGRRVEAVECGRDGSRESAKPPGQQTSPNWQVRFWRAESVELTHGIAGLWELKATNYLPFFVQAGGQISKDGALRWGCLRTYMCGLSCTVKDWGHEFVI